MKRCIVVMLVCLALPGLSWAQAPSNEELYQMIKEMERKLDVAIGEANKAKEEAARAKEEAVRAKEEAAKAREELARIKETPALVPEETVIRDPGLRVSFENLFMRPSRSNLDFVIVDHNNDSDPQGSLSEVEPGYHWGGRAALAYDFSSGTDVCAEFTWIKAEESESFVQPSGGRLWGTWLHPDSVIGWREATSATASYDFEHYVADLGVGKWVDIGKYFSMRMEAGLRYAEIEQDLNITYIDSVNNERVDITNENDFSGWGGRVGVGIDCRLGGGFSIFSSVGGSVLVGDADLSFAEVDQTGIGTAIPVDIKDSATRVVPVIDLKAGIGYEYQFKNGCSVGVKAGYEFQNWFNMMTVHRFSDDVADQLSYTDTTDIGLDGFFIEGVITF